jgi:hypothetical protein
MVLLEHAVNASVSLMVRWWGLEHPAECASAAEVTNPGTTEARRKRFAAVVNRFQICLQVCCGM